MSVTTQTKKPYQHKGKTALASDKKPPSGQPVTNIATLIEKHVLSGSGIPFIMVLAISGWIFVQDNEAGRLETGKTFFGRSRSVCSS